MTMTDYDVFFPQVGPSYITQEVLGPPLLGPKYIYIYESTSTYVPPTSVFLILSRCPHVTSLKLQRVEFQHGNNHFMYIDYRYKHSLILVILAVEP